MSNDTPVAMPAPYGQVIYGHRAPEEPVQQEFDWESYFKKELVNDHRQVEVKWNGENHVEYAQALAKMSFADDHDSVENPKHYVEHEIEPIEYIMKNHLDFAEGCVVKYISRHRLKNGAEDVKKAIKFCEFILKYTYHKD